MKVKVTTKFDVIDLVDSFADSTTVNAVGDAVVLEAKSMIESGISPVRGYGRFESYKNKDKYPAKKKPAKPVNLYLSGDMLAAFSFQQKNKNSIEIGILNASSDIKARAQAHNEGTDFMAMRRFIPQSGEEWAVSIMRKVRDICQKRLFDLIAKSNR